MTQTAVNSAKVLYDLSTDKDDIKNAENILSLTPVFKEVLECPIVSLDKKEKDFSESKPFVRCDKLCKGNVQSW